MDELSRDWSRSRYSRQVLFSDFGPKGQERLSNSRVTLVGCGALGSVIASTLVRAGVGHIRICDRDYVELDNLQRQVLFDESDIASGLPKAEAAGRKLKLTNSEVRVEPVVTHVDAGNINELARDADLVMDGTDNFETRFLLNDWSVKNGKPWVYGAVIGASGLVMTVIPCQTACLKCIFEEAPPPEMNPTCDTAGVIGPAVNLVASWQCMEAMKLLAGRSDALAKGLISIDAWAGRVAILNVRRNVEPNPCSCCVSGQLDYLEGQALSTGTVLCGRDAVQITPPQRMQVSFASLAEKVRSASEGAVSVSAFLMRAKIEQCDVTVFPDGRAIIKGTKSIPKARAIYDRYIGS